MAATIPILTYHSLDESGSVVSTPPGVFRQQMRQLRKSGFQTISLLAALANIRAGGTFGEKTLVLTFDDGYRSLFRHGLPVLQECGFEATIFVISGFCGKTNNWPGHNAPIRDEPLASWEELDKMKDAGMTIGAHTVTHPDLTLLPTPEVENEVLTSRDTIRKVLGVQVATFAYPYGYCDSRIRQVVAGHFAGACSVKLGNARLGADPYLLPRIDSFYLLNPVVFHAFHRGWADSYFALRSLLRSARGAMWSRQ